MLTRLVPPFPSPLHCYPPHRPTHTRPKPLHFPSLPPGVDFPSPSQSVLLLPRTATRSFSPLATHMLSFPARQPNKPNDPPPFVFLASPHSSLNWTAALRHPLIFPKPSAPSRIFSFFSSPQQLTETSSLPPSPPPLPSAKRTQPSFPAHSPLQPFPSTTATAEQHPPRTQIGPPLLPLLLQPLTAPTDQPPPTDTEDQPHSADLPRFPLIFS